MAKLEKLMNAYDAHLRHGDFMTCVDPRGFIRSYNIMIDAAIDCGMAHDEADPDLWIGERVTGFLLAA